MNSQDQEMVEVSQRLTTPPPEDDTRSRVPRTPPRQNTCWQDFTHSVSRFCGLVDDEHEIADKWQLRLDDLHNVKGKELIEDEPDGHKCTRCACHMPISMATPSKRSQRSTLTEVKQDDIFSTAIDGFKELLDQQPKKSKRKPQLRSRSFTPAAIRMYGHPRSYSDYDNVPDDEVPRNVNDVDARFGRTLNDSFYSRPVGTSKLLYDRAAPLQQYRNLQDKQQQFYDEDEDEADGGQASNIWRESGDWMSRTKPHHSQARRAEPEPLGFEAGFADPQARQQRERPDRSVKLWTDQIGLNANRRQASLSWFSLLLEEGIFARLCDFKLTAQAKSHTERPLFSIWMTFVQVLIFIVSLAVYGFAPIGFDEIILSQEIIQPNLALKLESYREKANLWIGPRQADLITLGAKFSPCMRRDTNVYTAIGNDRFEENKTACCIYNDGSGCVQSQKIHCSSTLATWKKWTPSNPGDHNKRVSGSVCGQDPKFCKSPPSIAPFVWPDDITKWPICEETTESNSKLEEDRHAVCDVVGRPCCKGIQGECVITTREHCDFFHGHFHEEASLCAQVNCMKDICGMLPFANPEYPDQFYRLWTCLFLHAGLVHLLITILFNLLVMVSLEKTIGWIRVVIIYMGSGVCGSLSSAIFVPYHVEAGASGSQFGLLATLLVLLIQDPANLWHATLKIILFLLFLLIIGLLPMVDNYAHLVGFLFGFLISFAILPFARFKYGVQSLLKQRIITMVACSGLALGLAITLIMFFYVAPVYNCPGCQYFNCIPLTPTFCDTMEVKIRGVSTL